MEVYKRIIAVRSTIVGTTGMRRTRAGHILIEFDRKVTVGEVTEKLEIALSDQTEVSALVNRVTI